MPWKMWSHSCLHQGQEKTKLVNIKEDGSVRAISFAEFLRLAAALRETLSWHSYVQANSK